MSDGNCQDYHRVLLPKHVFAAAAVAAAEASAADGEDQRFVLGPANAHVTLKEGER